jgi:phosphohistidine phosphatase SixA
MRSRLGRAASWQAIASLSLLLNISVAAQAHIPAPARLQLPPAEPPGLLLPHVNPAQQIPRLKLVDELRKGGFVLYMRHAETGRITEQCGISNLTVEGEEQARLVGAFLRALNIPVDKVWSSPACRALDTARLLEVAEISLTDDLAQVAVAPGQHLESARRRRLNTPPNDRSNIVLVSHMHSGTSRREWIHLAIGEVIVFRHMPFADAVPVARILMRDWATLNASP